MSFNEDSTNKGDKSTGFYPEENIISIKDFPDDKNLDDNEIILNDEIIFCGCCESSCRIKFKSKTQLNIKCENAWKILETSIFNKDYIKTRKFIGTLKNLLCTSHNKIYEIYCKNCKMNRCTDCNVENNCQKHKTISLKSENINVLNTYINNNYHPNLNNKDENSFCYLLKTLIFTHEKYPNIKTYKSIASACELIELLNSGKKENEKIVLKEGLSIKDYPGLRKKNIKLGKAFNIYLNNTNFKKLKYLSKTFLKDNSKLLKLTLAGNNLTNIKFLSYAKMDKLELLDLSRNKLGNRNIKHLAALQCRNLKELYLHHNMFNDYTIFNIISKNFNLTLFYIGFNKFEKNFDKLEACKFINLDEIGLNYVFNKETNKKLQEFEMPNLEHLFVQNNEINSIDFLKKMNIPKLKSLYINKNELKEIDIDVLTKFPNLDNIIFDCNSISKIINIEKIKDLKNLEEFSIEYNKLDSNTKKILENIKKENKKLKLYA